VPLSLVLPVVCVLVVDTVLSFELVLSIIVRHLMTIVGRSSL
jgi:hypothetical protein